MKLSKLDWLLSGLGVLGAILLAGFGCWTSALMVMLLMLFAVSIDKRILF